MDLRTSGGSESRFSAFVEGLVSVIGHADRARPLFDYCIGLIMPGERKSVEPMAAVTAPDRTAAQHQSLLHFVGQSPWSDEGVLAKVGEMVLPAIERHGPIEAWIIDDTGFPKKGAHSVGVARQYCGQLGKQDNCQVAVSLSLANHHASLPAIERHGPIEAWIIDDTGFPKKGAHSVGVARQYCGQLGKQDSCQVAVSLSLANHHASLPAMYRLYLPQEWAADKKRRRKAGVPKEISFKTKPEIALEQIEAACRAGLARGVVLMDAGYGCNTDLRTSISALGLTYVAGILPNTTVWTSGAAAAEKMVGQRATTKAAAPRPQASTDFGQGACSLPS
jgi:SRSO17 transposase